MFIGLPAWLILLSLFGLGLPAIVARNPRYRLWAGVRASPGIALGLLLGPGLVGGLIAALLHLAAPGLNGLPVLRSGPGTWAMGTLFTTLYFLPTILAVAVLCRAYQRAYPPKP